MGAQIATPFVRLADYQKWAKNQGCKIQSGYASGLDGMETFTVITAPWGSGKFVVIHDIEMDEYIPAHAFQYYDRRLGLKSDDSTYGTKAILPF